MEGNLEKVNIYQRVENGASISPLEHRVAVSLFVSDDFIILFFSQVLKPLDVKTKFYNAEVNLKDSTFLVLVLAFFYHLRIFNFNCSVLWL